MAFRSKCSRRGCGYVFEYDGPNPLGNIQRLVRRHSPMCRGLKAETTQLLRRCWCRGPPDSDAMCVNEDMETIRGGYDARHMKMKRTFRAASSETEPSLPRSATNTRSLSPSASSQPSLRTCTTRTVRHASPFAPKKSARSEAERRLALESDPCALRGNAARRPLRGLSTLHQARSPEQVLSGAVGEASREM
ncbi:hypothetical protein MSAN_02121600 [Mycena sanguinolenta]|uniref:Uncharacterized protein n=1 Tax=Mycena sanguinolenta TaxID=230812 RepID=A0A8H6XG96_9AGAR|nr:hypothetical protein MSAN_02121600 [Mycena sanguinolenta]